jgi:predicted MPP superfamily phosphohydrolase
MDMLLLKKAIYWGSWLVFPFLAFVLWRFSSRWLQGILVLGCFIFIWARFVEPNIIQVRTTQLDASGMERRIVLISDMHLGLFKGADFLSRVVTRINELDPDLVFIAGDFTYHPADIPSLYSPLKELRAPVYAVLGNHDVGQPGPPVRGELAQVLPQYGVRLLENETVRFPDFTLVGLGDRWAGEDDLRLLRQVSDQELVIVLTHNPDTTRRYRNFKADFTLCGHTHGGQIRIPGLYQKVIPTIGPFDRGLTREPYTELFISSGLGEIGLPMRLFNPPVIDVLHFSSH